MAALSSLRIFTQYNNEPYVRSLTATLQWNPNDANTWVTFSSAGRATLNYYNVAWNIQTTGGTIAPITTAFNPTNNKIIRFGESNSDIPDNINPIIINFSTPSYNPTLFSYNLNNISLSAGVQLWPNYPLDANGYAVVGSTPITYDNFPEITGDLFVNYESASKNNTFYRLTSSAPYTANINITSNSFPINTAFNNNYYKTILTLNNSQTLNSLNQINTFNVTTPVICSLQATISAISAVGSIASFYTPHTIFLNSISGIFVNSLPSANFIAYPSQFFTNAIALPTQLNASNYTLSPGVCFYGEGHTEKINLSAASGSGITNYIWKDITGKPFLNLSSPFTSNTNVLSVATTIGNYPTIPIGLQITTAAIPSTAPIIKYSDVDGSQSYYPYYNTTVDIGGNELITNNYLHQSIKVVPYEDVTYAFDAGYTDPIIYLPADGSSKQFLATLYVGYNGPTTIQPCYDKYGIDWQWLTFENCTNNHSAFTQPSSWTTTGSAGAFPKKWYNECNSSSTNCSAGIVTPSPVGCVGSNTTWTLSTPDWYVPPQAEAGNSFSYAFNFSTPFVPPFNNIKNGIVGGIFPATRPTVGHITVTESVTCRINIPNGDWLPKVTTVSATSAFTVQGAPVLRLYTPNRYVVTGTNILFENIISNAGFLSDLTIDFGDSNQSYLTGSNVSNNLYHIYNTIGPKTIQLSGTSTYGGLVTKTFPNIVTVVNNYDDVTPNSYITTNTPLTPPNTTAPLIAANDNAVADNINNSIISLYNNLNYLQQRSKVYPNTTLDKFGWLGVPHTYTAVTDITGYRWKDFYNTNVTWFSLSCYTVNNTTTPVVTPVSGVTTGPIVNSNQLTYTIDITANANNISTNAKLIQLGWDQVTPVSVFVIVHQGVTVYSNSITNPALTIDSLPGDSKITLENLGTIIGCGGAGGGPGQTGGPGGPALELNYLTTVFNTGSILGGGGGGAGGNNYKVAASQKIVNITCCRFNGKYTAYNLGTGGCTSNDSRCTCMCNASWSYGHFYSGCANYSFDGNCPQTVSVPAINETGGTGGAGQGLDAATSGTKSIGTTTGTVGTVAGNGGNGGNGGNSGYNSSDGNEGGAAGASIVNITKIISNKNLGVELPAV
jgi:hypothetical protein